MVLVSGLYKLDSVCKQPIVSPILDMWTWSFGMFEVERLTTISFMNEKSELSLKISVALNVKQLSLRKCQCLFWFNNDFKPSTAIFGQAWGGLGTAEVIFYWNWEASLTDWNESGRFTERSWTFAALFTSFKTFEFHMESIYCLLAVEPYSFVCSIWNVLQWLTISIFLSFSLNSKQVVFARGLHCRVWVYHGSPKYNV